MQREQEKPNGKQRELNNLNALYFFAIASAIPYKISSYSFTLFIERKQLLAPLMKAPTFHPHSQAV
jgi:hypothetical protein